MVYGIFGTKEGTFLRAPKEPFARSIAKRAVWLATVVGNFSTTSIYGVENG